MSQSRINPVSDLKTKAIAADKMNAMSQSRINPVSDLKVWQKYRENGKNGMSQSRINPVSDLKISEEYLEKLVPHVSIPYQSGL